MRKLLGILVVAFGLIGMAEPAHAQFCPGVSPWVFDDVLASDPFCGFVTKMAQQNVTLGCVIVDGNHRLYCPDENVTRKQMAGFMARLGDALLPLTCAAGQVMKWNGTQWACANDNTGGGGGTVTSVLAGTGLTGSPNPITGAGSLNIAASFQLPQACANGQVPKSNGSGGWACAADATGTGTVTSVAAGTGLTGGTITGSGTLAVDTSYVQRRVSSTCAVGSSIRAIAADGSVTCQTDNAGPANAFVQGGNAFGVPALLGTADSQPLTLVIGTVPVLRISRNGGTPNIVGGSDSNQVAAGVIAATISGGGGGSALANVAGANYTTVGGGADNQATGLTATIGGGAANRAAGLAAVVAGGASGTAGADYATVSGGFQGVASGGYSVVAGGRANQATGAYSAATGGYLNTATGLYSVVLGGGDNHATGPYATVVGGALNNANGSTSIAMGYRALTTSNAMGSFVFSDASPGEFGSGQPNEFLVGATGGIGLYTSKVYQSGCTIAAGGGQWNCFSSRDGKADFAAVDPATVLDRVLTLPISTWRYRGEAGDIRHLGPMAQDFHAAFGLGHEDTSIGVLDGNGVALAAIQGLHAQLRERDGTIAAMRAQLDALAAMVMQLRTAR